MPTGLFQRRATATSNIQCVEFSSQYARGDSALNLSATAHASRVAAIVCFGIAVEHSAPLRLTINSYACNLRPHRWLEKSDNENSFTTYNYHTPIETPLVWKTFGPNSISTRRAEIAQATTSRSESTNIPPEAGSHDSARLIFEMGARARRRNALHTSSCSSRKRGPR